MHLRANHSCFFSPKTLKLLLLTFLGMTPVVGFVADIANAGISTARGNYAAASIDLAAAIPGAGQAVAGAKLAGVGIGLARISRGVDSLGSAANRTTRTNFNQYEAIFESPITGTSRSAHRNSANSFFANQLENSTDLQRAVNNEFGTDVLQHMNSGSGRNLLNPPGTQWHHPIDNPNVMQLLRTGEHTNPMLQPVLHSGPNGTGGFGTFF